MTDLLTYLGLLTTTDRLTDLMTDLTTDLLTVLLTDLLTYQLTDWLTDLLADLLTYFGLLRTCPKSVYRKHHGLGVRKKSNQKWPKERITFVIYLENNVLCRKTCSLACAWYLSKTALGFFFLYFYVGTMFMLSISLILKKSSNDQTQIFFKFLS